MVDIRPREGRTEPTFGQASGNNARRILKWIIISTVAAVLLFAAVWGFVAWKAARTDVSQAPFTQPAATAAPTTDAGVGWASQQSVVTTIFKKFLDRVSANDPAGAAAATSRGSLYVTSKGNINGYMPFDWASSNPSQAATWTALKTDLRGLTSSDVQEVKYQTQSSDGHAGVFTFTTLTGAHGSFSIYQGAADTSAGLASITL